MNRMPNKIRKRILDRCARDEAVVVVPRNGVPSRCFGVEEYQKMREQPLKHQPWKQRQAARDETPDPLGAVNGKARSPLRREDMYE
jgi:hypothetical protein